MTHLPSIVPGIAFGLFVALTGACGAQPGQPEEAYDAGFRRRDAGWQPRDVPHGDSAPTVNYMRSVRADLDRPDARAGFAMSEGQILGVLETINTGEIRQGNVAQAQGFDPRVQAYGTRMVNARADSIEQLRSVSLRLGITSADSTLSQSIRSDYANTAARLDPLSGAPFDREFVQAQVQQNARTLELIDTLLLPNAPDEALRAVLEGDVRPPVLLRLGQARELQAALTAP